MSHFNLGSMAYQNSSNVAITGGSITGMSNPSVSSDVANKSYVDTLVAAMAAGVVFKQAVRVVQTSALPAYVYSNKVITFSSNGALPTIDGVGLTNGQRLLITGETAGNQKYNGLYTVTDVGSAGTPVVLTRATDYDTDAEVAAGDCVVVQEGTTYKDSMWMLTTDESIVLDTTGLTFTKLNLSAMSAVLPLSIAGSTISFIPTLSTKTGNYTVIANDNQGVVLCNAAGTMTVTLPNSGIASGFRVSVKDISGNAVTNNITIDGNGANIDAASTAVISKNYEARTLCYNGTQWYMI